MMKPSPYDDYEKSNYLLPTLRDGVTMTQFIGAVKTRIADRQKALWSRFIGAGFTCEDIERIYPEPELAHPFTISSFKLPREVYE